MHPEVNHYQWGQKKHVPPICYNHIWLVVKKNNLEKYEGQWEGLHPIYEMENKTYLKPPTRLP